MAGWYAVLTPPSGINRKFQRAESHIKDLESAIRRLNDRDPYRVSTKDKSETGQRVAYVAEIHDFLADELESLSLIVGDAAHNARSALDHLAGALVTVPDARTSFPIWRRGGIPSPQQMDSIVGSTVGSATKQMRQALAMLQPYEGGTEQWLWALDYLDVVDKHRLLLTVGYSLRDITFDAANHIRAYQEGLDVLGVTAEDIPSVYMSLAPAERKLLKVGAELFAAPVERFKVYGDIKFALDVAFGEPEILRGEAVVPALRYLIHATKETIEGLVAIA